MSGRKSHRKRGGRYTPPKAIEPAWDCATQGHLATMVGFGFGDECEVFHVCQECGCDLDDDTAARLSIHHPEVAGSNP